MYGGDGAKELRRCNITNLFNRDYRDTNLFTKQFYTELQTTVVSATPFFGGHQIKKTNMKDLAIKLSDVLPDTPQTCSLSISVLVIVYYHNTYH